MRSFFLAFGVAFVSEFGDKSQFLALAFATRFRARTVILGIFLAASVLFAASVAVGAFLGSSLPTRSIGIVAGMTFIGFGVWTYLGRDEGDVSAVRAVAARAGVLVVAGAFLIAEFGDKTMLATLALAAREGAVGTWAGAVLGMVTADALTIVAGRALGARFPERTLRVASAMLFVTFGVAFLVQSLTG